MIEICRRFAPRTCEDSDVTDRGGPVWEAAQPVSNGKWRAMAPCRTLRLRANSSNCKDVRLPLLLTRSRRTARIRGEP